MARYIFITGGVVSSLGKGLTAASIAKLMEARNLKVAMLKLDPYLNVDPGTMNPGEHGEVYVTKDGREADLDLGHYYRFTEECEITRRSVATAGEVYETILRNERRGDYHGRTVQTFPHVIDEIKRRIRDAADGSTDIVIVEIGGTVGDTEQGPFLKAIQQFRVEERSKCNGARCINVHMSLIVYLRACKEMKTKPTQHSVQMLNAAGIVPDMLILRTEQSLDRELIEKTANMCGVPPSCVFQEVDLSTTIYELPIVLNEIGVDAKLLELVDFGVTVDPPMEQKKLMKWRGLINNISCPVRDVRIAIIGKYLSNSDAYKSIVEAINHAAYHEKVRIDLEFVPAENCELKSPDSMRKSLSKFAGVIVPGGFGVRGWRGKLNAVRACRSFGIPILGICLGMQAMCVEYVRDVDGIIGADSTEMREKTGQNLELYPIVDLLPEQKSGILGGTMRLGEYKCAITPGTMLESVYDADYAFEIHRHRYEVNPELVGKISPGLIISGRDAESNLVEAVEVAEFVDPESGEKRKHPFMVGVQFHPEFKSKFEQPHPLFRALLGAAMNQ